jgi:hypothetical protein
MPNGTDVFHARVYPEESHTACTIRAGSRAGPPWHAGGEGGAGPGS